MTILMTEASEFIGTAPVKSLSKNQQITALGRQLEKLELVLILTMVFLNRSTFTWSIFYSGCHILCSRAQWRLLNSSSTGPI